MCHLNGLNQDEINLSELVELYDESVSQNEKDKLILYIEQSINKIKEIDKLSLEEQILDPFYFLIKAGNKRLLSKRLGLDGDDPLTLEETSELWPKKISRQRVQQIEAKFLKQINLKKFYIPKFDDLISELKPMLPLSQDKLIKFFSSQNEKIFTLKSLQAIAKTYNKDFPFKVKSQRGNQFLLNDKDKGFNLVLKYA